jgi:hypothetical protein
MEAYVPLKDCVLFELHSIKTQKTLFFLEIFFNMKGLMYTWFHAAEHTTVFKFQAFYFALLNNGTTELPIHNELFITFHFAD